MNLKKGRLKSVLELVGKRNIDRSHERRLCLSEF
jgi:hypothetical protein